MTQRNTHSQALKGAGKKYTSPTVTEFGKVRELTTGGSSMASEMGPGDNHPNKRS